MNTWISTPEALRYILWRYETEHRGEDHQARVAEVRAWLATLTAVTVAHEQMGAEYKLCYVEDQWAYFTTQKVTDQWGDDWNDAPYEHNAGTPYLWHEARPEPPYKIAMVAFDVEFATPAQPFSTSYSPYSVEAINHGATPWLKSPPWVDKENAIEIWAGTPYPEFVELIQLARGAVYVPRKDAKECHS